MSSAIKNEFLRYITQLNGQIIYKRPGSLPIQKGAEIIMKNLPRVSRITDVIDLVLPYGELEQVRLLIDFSQNCRGFAYAAFKTKQMAQHAIRSLNHSLFLGYKLYVDVSLDNRRLYFDNIPKNCSEPELDRIIRDNCQNVAYIVPYMNYLKPSLNRGFLFVEFHSHCDAAQARRSLVSYGFRQWPKRVIKVEWAEPEVEIPEYQTMNIKKVFLRNIHGCDGPLTDFELMMFLRNYVQMMMLVDIGPIIKDRVILEFNAHHSAVNAVRALDGTHLNGHRVFAELAREVHELSPNGKSRFAKKSSFRQPSTVCMSPSALPESWNRSASAMQAV